MTNLNLSVDDALATTRSVRKRLDFDRPVDDVLIRECLELAIQAPTGSNSQGWQFLVVTDADKRSALGDIYKRGFEMYTKLGSSAAALAEGQDDARSAQQQRVMESAFFLAENMHRVPAMLVPCLPGRLDQMSNMAAASTYASIIPSVWSFMIAARERGLGTCWTTIHLIHEQEAADVLGIPYEEVTQVALITVGHTLGTDFKAATRVPLEEFTFWNTWGD
ncbi:MAG: nitroreductase family protein [Actinomycetota bacterium]|nr:nitroreductase family protein [Actinomycetota bacterium]